jgi:hypothetical protein
MTRLVSAPARAAAAEYGWSILPHDNGGFLAQRGPRQVIVTFAPDGSFRHASTQEGLNGLAEFLLEGAVVATLAQYGSERPVSSEGNNA